MTRVDLASISPAIPLGPLDGRYRAAAAPLVNHLSEAALNRARLEVEVEWLIHLTATGALPGAPELSEDEVAYLREIVGTFGEAEIAEMRSEERRVGKECRTQGWPARRKEQEGDSRRW